MAYAEQQDIIDRGVTQQELLELTDDESTTDLDDAGVQARIAAAITSACGTIDSYCRQRYTVPLQDSEQIKSVAVTLAIYNLFARRRRVPEDVKTLFDDAMKFLRDVAAGKAALDQPTGATAQAGSGGVLATDVAEKFSDDNLKGFI